MVPALNPQPCLHLSEESRSLRLVLIFCCMISSLAQQSALGREEKTTAKPGIYHETLHFPICGFLRFKAIPSIHDVQDLQDVQDPAPDISLLLGLWGL